MRTLYTVLLHLALPLVMLRLLWRSMRAPAYRQRWLERLGIFSTAPAAEGGIWVHAVSVGEVQAVEPLVNMLLRSYPDLSVTITTTTPTGSDRVKRLFGEEVFHVYFPYDMPWSLGNFLRRVNPGWLLMVETEVWPNLLAVCEARGIPTLLANARLSSRSASSYARFGSFSRETFRRISKVAAQSQQDAERFVELGVPAERINVTGSIKFDMKIPASVLEKTQVIRRYWGEDRPVWVAASTHEGEEEQVLQAHARVLQALPSALLVLVPRHPERFDKVVALCQRKDFATVRRSSGEPCSSDTSVFVGDTMGELPVFLGAADVAFIGGSLVKTGGHNMLEAAAQGAPVVFGPHVFNFPAISSLLQEKEAAVQVADQRALAELLIHWLSDASERSRIGENGRRVVRDNRGALQRLTALVVAMLPAKS